ncbi:MAG: AAA family ATPase, partial [Polaromonas sp.]|nr:AAA family ATPase [Polaromonas sp.]
MKLTLKNFGPISHCELDLKTQFTMIVGHNNIGKSYAISLLYALIKTFNRFRQNHIFYSFNEEYRETDTKPITKFTEEISEKIKTNTNPETFEVTDQIINILKTKLEQTLTVTLQQTLYGTFTDINNLQNRLSKQPLEILLEDDDFSISFTIIDGKLILNKLSIIKHYYFVKQIKQNRTVKDSEHRSTIYFPTGNPAHFQQNVKLVIFQLEQSLIERVCGEIYAVHYLPASRSGLYQSLSAFGQIVAELSKNRNLLRQKIELPGIAEPLSDYFLKLSDIKAQAIDEADKAFHDIADEIEREILRGKVEIDSKSKKISFKPDRVGLSLDLSTTSSMVSEITPVAAYIRHVLPKSVSTKRLPPWLKNESISQLLFLEEPEAHLHPEIQIKLIGVLAKLASKTKTKIIITSHSNYIFNKCSN